MTASVNIYELNSILGISSTATAQPQEVSLDSVVLAMPYCVKNRRQMLLAFGLRSSATCDDTTPHKCLRFLNLIYGAWSGLKFKKSGGAIAVLPAFCNDSGEAPIVKFEE